MPEIQFSFHFSWDFKHYGSQCISLVKSSWLCWILLVLFCSHRQVLVWASFLALYMISVVLLEHASMDACLALHIQSCETWDGWHGDAMQFKLYQLQQVAASGKVPFSQQPETLAWLWCFRKMDVAVSPHWHFGTSLCNRCPRGMISDRTQWIFDRSDQIVALHFCPDSSDSETRKVQWWHSKVQLISGYSCNFWLPSFKGSVAIFQAGLFSNIAHAPPKLQAGNLKNCGVLIFYTVYLAI